MKSEEMLKYTRTPDMEELYLMVKNEAPIYERWHWMAWRLAKRYVANGKLPFNTLAENFGSKIAKEMPKLMARYSFDNNAWLVVHHKEQKIVAWQWFYDQLMDCVAYIKFNQDKENQE